MAKKTALLFEVWHRDTPSFFNNDPDTLAAFPVGFTHVADVTTDHVGRVFELTNHIHDDWRKNAGVVALGAARHGVRSTSVGDVIVAPTDEAGVPVFPGHRWTINGVGLGSF